ncbi:exosortase, partial [Oleiphilus sp. HI0117]
MTRIARQPVLWLAAIFALLLCYLGTFYPSRLVQLHTHWTTAGDLDMGYILLALSAYFSYKNLGSNKVQPNYLLLPAVILLTAGFVLSQALDIKTLFFLCLALSLPLFSAIVLGFASTRNIIIAWSVVLMAMPFWYLAIPFLQTLTVKVVSYLASLLSLTVLVEGNYFTVTTGVVHVAGGCSGLKYFMTALSLALISSAFNRRRFRHALISLAIAATLAMIGNWIRVFILLLIAYYEGVSHPLMEDHDTLGWIVFGAVMLPWFFIDRHFDAEGEQESPVKQDTSQPLKQQILSLTACTVLLIISQLALSPPENREYQVSQPKLPKTLNGLTLDTTRATNWKPHFPQPTNLTRGLYGAFGDQLDLYILTYLNNSNVEMANSQNTIFDKNRWQLINDYA